LSVKQIGRGTIEWVKGSSGYGVLLKGRTEKDRGASEVWFNAKL